MRLTMMPDTINRAARNVKEIGFFRKNENKLAMVVLLGVTCFFAVYGLADLTSKMLRLVAVLGRDKCDRPA